MEPIKKIISGGDHPIYLEQYGSDNVSAKGAAHDDAEGSQSWSESHDESAMSSASDEPAPGSSGEELAASPRRKLIVALKYKEIRQNNRAVRRARNLLGSELASNDASSSNGSRKRNEEGLDYFEQSDTESDSIASNSSDDSGPTADPQVRVVGQQFQDGNEPIPDFNDDSDLDAIVSI